MIREIHANGIGLQDSYDILLSQRLNIFTGDNGLGKSFMLDLAWWCLTGSWFGQKAFPRPSYKIPAIVAEMADTQGRQESTKTEFDRETQSWIVRQSINRPADIVIYAGTDGRFAVWDRLRFRLSLKEQDNVPFYGTKPPARMNPTYFFDNKTIWEGLRDDDTGRVRCKGFIQDVVDWQSRTGEIQHAGLPYMMQALQTLSTQDEVMSLGEISRLFVDDVREIPTIKFSYGSVPIILCSSGVQRIVAFAYLLVWAWKEHIEAAKVIGVEPGNDLVLIIDEVELHLHPKWQREILPAILRIAGILSPELHTQLIATTHSPLVLASLEPYFDSDLDSLFLFSEKDNAVMLENLPLAKEGDVDSWLESEVFGLGRASSVEAEVAIKDAELFLEGKSSKSAAEIEAVLKKYLPGIDPFLARWLMVRSAK